jgi:hypothetical protein
MRTDDTRLVSACLISLAFLGVALIPALVLQTSIAYAQPTYAICSTGGAVGCYNCATNPSPGVSPAGCTPIPAGWSFGACVFSPNPFSGCLSGTFNCGAYLDCATGVQVGNCQWTPVCS